MIHCKKVVITVKEQSPVLLGAVVNVPVGVNETCDKLPNCDHIVLMKKKRN